MSESALDASVVVIGAGVEGLAAARCLIRKNRSVIVPESRDRIGGRAYPTTTVGLKGASRETVLAVAANPRGCRAVRIQ
jgi:monoamine oxidase